MAALICVAVIAIDQILKIWVKTTFPLGGGTEVTSWFYIRFIENNGMAYGMEIGSKLFLTLFRIVAVVALIWYMCKIHARKSIKYGYMACIALITAGAAGNIIDCVFYGEIFNNPPYPEVASFVPWGEGYGTLFHGRVVDMLYFPLVSFDWPSWVPVVGGGHFTFFDPVFNFADAAITTGILALLIFYYKTLGSSAEELSDANEKED